MEGEEEAGQPGAGQRETADEKNDKAGAESVQQDVEQMITDDSVAPDAVLQPEGAVEQRIVLLGCAEVKPDAPEPFQRLHGGPREMSVVIPERTAPLTAGR